MSQRDITKAARLFKHRIIEAEYDSDTESFYKDIHNQWVSCLMIKTSTLKKDTLWMFDCDTEEEYKECLQVLENFAIIEYKYRTKNEKGALVLKSSVFQLDSNLKVITMTENLNQTKRAFSKVN